MLVTNGPLTDFWSVCHPSLANSQTPRPPPHTHSGPLSAEIPSEPGEDQLEGIGKTMIGWRLQVYDAGLNHLQITR